MDKLKNDYSIYFEKDWSDQTCRAVNIIVRNELGYSEYQEGTDRSLILTPKGMFKNPIEIVCDSDLPAIREIMDKTLKEIFFDYLPYNKDDQQVHHNRIALYDSAEKLLSVFEFDQGKDEFIEVATFPINLAQQ